MKARNMTAGKPFHLLLSFALPLILGSVFQQCYTVVDTIIVGQGVGVSALASLGAGDWLNWMVVGLIQALTQGFSIETAQAFGEGNHERLSEAVFHSLLLSALTAAAVTAVSLSLVRPALLLMDTPAHVLAGTLTYLRTMYAGTLVVTAYNLAAALLRAVGDSRTPLRAMIAASLTNIVMDLAFVYLFHWGIFGAAFATVLAQGLAAAICIYALREVLQVDLHQPIRREKCILLWKLGAPLAFQVLVIAGGGLVVQTVVNRYGLIFVAAYTAANKMFGILESAGIAFGYGISTYVGQNLGAGRIDRIPEGMKAGILFSLAVSAGIAACMILFGRNILSMFLSADNPDFDEVIAYAYRYLKIMSCALPLLYFLHLYKNALQGLGETMKPMISGFIELIMRVAAVMILPLLIGADGVFLAEVMAWLGAASYLSFHFRRALRERQQAAAG